MILVALEAKQASYKCKASINMNKKNVFTTS